MDFSHVIVGSGFAGSVTARRLADAGFGPVLIIDKKNHIGGHAYDAYNKDGVLIHVYGPHIFHTNNEMVWNWLSRFTEWHHYQHRVLAYVDGRLVPIPITVETINTIFGLALSVEEFPSWLENHKEKISEIKTSADAVLSKVGNEVYEKIFRNYTYKQWGRYPEELDPSIAGRIPIRMGRDTRYFSDKYQGIPKEGYAKMFERILDHKNIRIMLNTDWKEVKNYLNWGKLIYTGPVDEYYEYRFGHLQYRSIRFEYETLQGSSLVQPVATINYPNDYSFTRATEYRHITGQKCDVTTIAREYSSAEGDPYYVIPGAGEGILALYKNIHQENTVFLGRLAEYKYYNMDQVVEKALTSVVE